LSLLNVFATMTITPDLPPSDSARLALLHPTPEEKRATWHLNSQAWRGPMDLPTYIRREMHLEDQAFTRDGGITFWILADTTLPPNERSILASCESLRKQAVIAREDGHVRDIISHGICSVFCNPDYRGRRYAQRMIYELGNKLDNWQQKEGEKASFTLLHSDIGKVGRLNQHLVILHFDLCHRIFTRGWVGMPFPRVISPCLPHIQAKSQ